MKKLTDKKIRRRAFLKGAAVAGTALGAAATQTAHALTEDAPATETPLDQGKGYRETEHIREYYRLARF